MKRLLLCLAVLVSAVAAAQVPSVTVETVKGESFDTADLLKDGKPMIISFWSTSCKPCIHELDAIYDALPDWQEEVDFKVVAVSVDNSRLLSKAKSFTQGRGWGEDFVLLFDKNEDFKRAMNVAMVPHVFVVDKKGKVVFTHTSYVQGGEAELLEVLKKL